MTPLHLLSKILAAILFSFNFWKTIPLKNLKVILKNKDYSQYKRILKYFIKHQFMNILEIIYYTLFPHMINKYVKWHKGSKKKIQDLLLKKKGLIINSMHFGNWELLGMFLAKNNIPLVSIYMNARITILESILNFIRKKHGIKLIPNNNLKKLIKSLKKGLAIALINDQDGGLHGIHINWNDKNISIPIGASNIALHYKDIPQVFVYIRRIKGLYHKVFVEELKFKSSDKKGIALEIFKRQMHIISKFPHEWLLFYDRFKKRLYDRNIKVNPNIKTKILFPIICKLLDIAYLLFIILTSPLLIIYLIKKGLLSKEKIKYWFGLKQFNSFQCDSYIHIISRGEYNNIKKHIPKDKRIVWGIVDPYLFSELKKHNNKHSYYILAPLDFSKNINKILNAFRPKNIIISEADIWPNLCMLSLSMDIPIYIINGRLSQKSFQFYKNNPLYKLFFKHLTVYPKDAINMKRFNIIGAKTEWITNLKLNTPELDNNTLIKIKKRFSIIKKNIITLGSSHKEDEIALFKSFMREYFYIIVPRDITRTWEIINMGKNFNLKGDTWENINNRLDFIVINAYGILPYIYHISNFSIIGGSFLDLGGHNIMEPAIQKTPVIHGPFIRNFEYEAKKLKSYGIAKGVSSPKEIRATIKSGFNPEWDKLYKWIKENEKAVKQSIKTIFN